MIHYSTFQKAALKLFRCLKCGNAMAFDGHSLSCPRCSHRYAILEDGVIDVTGTPTGLTPAQKAGQWPIVARWYDRLWRTRALSLLTGTKFPPEREHRLVFETLRPGDGAVVLDNACANAFSGRAVARIMKQGSANGVVIANDLSLPMLRTARALAVQEGVADRILLVRSDSEAMPFSRGVFDAAVCGGTLNEFQNPGAVIRELRRVLRRRGRASIMFQVRKGVFHKMLGRVSGLTFPLMEEALELFQSFFRPAVTFTAGAIAFVRLDPISHNTQRSKKRNHHVRSRRTRRTASASRPAAKTRT